LRLEQERTLQALITRLASRHGTHHFVPHLTVCSFEFDETSREAASVYARTSPLLPLRARVEDITYAVGNPFEVVFVRMVNSPELHRFREDLRGITGAGEFRPPHVSLFYGVRPPQTIVSFDATVLEPIARECRAELVESEYVLERPAFARPEMGTWLSVSEWRIEDL